MKKIIIYAVLIFIAICIIIKISENIFIVNYRQDIVALGETYEKSPTPALVLDTKIIIETAKKISYPAGMNDEDKLYLVYHYTQNHPILKQHSKTNEIIFDDFSPFILNNDENIWNIVNLYNNDDFRVAYRKILFLYYDIINIATLEKDKEKALLYTNEMFDFLEAGKYIVARKPYSSAMYINVFMQLIYVPIFNILNLSDKELFLLVDKMFKLTQIIKYNNLLALTFYSNGISQNFNNNTVINKFLTNKHDGLFVKLPLINEISNIVFLYNAKTILHKSLNNNLLDFVNDKFYLSKRAVISCNYLREIYNYNLLISTFISDLTKISTNIILSKNQSDKEILLPKISHFKIEDSSDYIIIYTDNIRNVKLKK